MVESGLDLRLRLTDPWPDVNRTFVIKISSQVSSPPNTNAMAAPRLPFLWPMLYKTTPPNRVHATRLHESPALASRPPRRSCRQFATSPRRAGNVTTQRYGKALEPAAHLRDGESPAENVPQTKATPPKATPAKALPEPAHEEAEEDEAPTPTATPSTPTPTTTKTSAVDDTTPPTKPPNPPKTADTKPPDSVLHMPSPQDEEHDRPPHLRTPPYVHHFDTYGLVRELDKSAYTRDQATTLMKAVRGMLISNMGLARDGLVSKSNVENETYLFRAACSELKTEIGNTRKGEIERMRTERAQLQHEVDILGQRLGQETGTLKDELKGLFDDRKMAVRQEQRHMETKVRFARPTTSPSPIYGFDITVFGNGVLTRCSRSKNSTTKSRSRSTPMRAAKSRACAGCLRAARRLLWGFRRLCCLWRSGTRVMCSISSWRNGGASRRLHISRPRRRRRCRRVVLMLRRRGAGS
jgi:hypothetical protein